MKIISKYWVLGTENRSHEQAIKEVSTAILDTKLILRPIKKANGVKPIKVGVIKHLIKQGWNIEFPMDLEGMRAKPLDAYKLVSDLKVGFEWETGNVSSSFRALMKLIKGVVEDQLDLGIHVLPSRAFYNYLTDRVGNIAEINPYLSVFGRIQIPDGKCVVIIVVEHDSEDHKVKLIPKGLDGMSISRRKKSGKRKTKTSA